MRDRSKWSPRGLSNPVFLRCRAVWSGLTSSQLAVESRQTSVHAWLQLLSWEKQTQGSSSCFSDCRAGGTGGCRAPELQLQKNWRCCLTLRGTESQRQPVPRCASQPCAGSVRITLEGLEVPDFILGSNFVSPNPRDSSLQGFGLAPKVMTGSICKLEMTFGFPGPPSIWAGLSRATSTSRCLGQSHV